MLTFLIVLLPLSIVVYEFEKKNPKDFMPILIGFLAAVLLCAFKVFFMFAHRIVPYSFSQNFAYFLFRMCILPVFIVYGIFFAISKDSFADRVDSFFPLICSFYMVYLPYIVVSSYSSRVYAGYDIFIKPLIFLAMIAECAICVKKIYMSIVEDNYLKCVFYSVILIAYLVLPALFETMYLLSSINYIFLVLLSVLFSFQPIAVLIISHLRK